jgi:hypothetical protein
VVFEGNVPGETCFLVRRTGKLKMGPLVINQNLEIDISKTPQEKKTVK